MRRQDGGVPSQGWRSMGSATGGGLDARRGFHSLVGVLAKALATRSGQVPIWPLARRQYAALGAPFLNCGTLEIASVPTEVNSIVPNLCAVYSRVNVPGKIPVLIHKYAIEIFRGRHFLED